MRYGQTNLPRAGELAHHWSLDPGVVYLNHGSFGATPRDVLEEQSRLRARMEADAVRFFVEELPGLMDRARGALADFLHCRAGDLAPMPNATTAVATVLDNLVSDGTLRAGAEMLTNSHEYPACQNNLRRAAARSGATIVAVDLPFPCPGPDAAAEAILARVTPRTRLALISHVTSPTGLVLPVQRLVRELESRGVRALIDGAHAPGMVGDLDLSRLNPSYYTANCHKWMCSPKGSAFLFVREDRRGPAGFRPLVLSNNAESPKPGRDQFLTEFDYLGTQDYSAFLAIPRAIECISAMVPGGWPEVIRRNRELCLRGRDVLCKALGAAPPAPDSMIGSIATVLMPPVPGGRAGYEKLRSRARHYFDPMQESLRERHAIQVPLWTVGDSGLRTIRISAQLYNSIEQVEYLARALKDELAREGSA